MAAEEGMETDQDEILLHSDTKQRYVEVYSIYLIPPHMHPLKHYFLFEIFGGFSEKLS